MLTIRLTRVGKKKQPTYRFIISEKARDPWGKSLEILGHYNPLTSPATMVVKEDRIKYWLGQGATTSDTVNNLLVEAKIITGEKRRIVKISNRRKATVAADAAKAEADKKAKEEKAAAKKAEDLAAEAAAKEAEKATEEAEEAAAKEAAAAPAPEAAPEAAPAEVPVEPAAEEAKAE